MLLQNYDELDSFKRNIDLRAYAEHLGYELDKSDSWRGAFVMRRGNDKIKIACNENGHWVYTSYRDPDDNGTIVDFVQRRRGLDLGHLRQELRAWVGNSLFGLVPPVRTVVAEQAPKDRTRVEREFAGMLNAPDHPYLLNDRGIPTKVLSSSRFQDRVRMGSRAAAVFPHFDETGICGYEIKNRGFTGFSPGGSKALWISQATWDDECLIFCESAVEALSYAALFWDDHFCYVSTAGYVGARQQQLIKSVIDGMGEGADIVAAMNDDPAGQALGQIIHYLFEAVSVECGREDLHFYNHRPRGFKDWNEQLIAKGVL